jgi:hypothetical protein
MLFDVSQKMFFIFGAAFFGMPDKLPSHFDSFKSWRDASMRDHEHPDIADALRVLRLSVTDA